jgi:glycosyltransferase involved in cell wall biosynthesis
VKLVYDAALFPGAGGGPRHFEGMARALGRSDCQLELVLPGKAPVSLRELPGRVHTLSCSSNNPILRQLQYELRRLLLILKWFVNGRRFDVWMARHAICGVTLVAARLVARHVVLEVNGPVKEEMRANYGSRAAAWLADLIFRIQMSVADSALAVTPGLANYLEQRRPRRPVLVIPNGADPTSSLSGVRARRTGLVFAGALTPWYALHVVIEAVALLRDQGDRVQLEVLGDGVARAELMGRIRELRLDDQVRVHGWVPPGAVTQALLSARVGVLPLVEKSEGLDVIGSPLKLYEYAAAGLRVVGTDVDGVRDTPVSDAVHVYEAQDPIACAEAIRAALAASPRPLGPETWSWDARADDLLQHLDLIASQGVRA